MNNIQRVSIYDIDWDYLNSQTPTLYSIKTLEKYDSIDVLIIKNKTLSVVWPIPIADYDNQRHVASEIRLLPYNPPVILKTHPLDRKKCLYRLVDYITQNYTAMDLSLSPNFENTTAFSAAGFNVEYRNTHIFTSNHRLFENLHPKAKNHFRYAENHLKISISEDPTLFDYERGIITANNLHRIHRKELAKIIFEANNGYIVNAYCKKKIVGQVLVVHDNHTAYLLHSWIDKDDGLRGSAIYLIDYACRYALEKMNLSQFDLEGSVLPQVDYFFSSLGGISTPYARIQWGKDKNRLLSTISHNIFCEERLDHEYYTFSDDN